MREQDEVDFHGRRAFERFEGQTPSRMSKPSAVSRSRSDQRTSASSSTIRIRADVMHSRMRSTRLQRRKYIGEFARRDRCQREPAASSASLMW